ncbi:hypothetical protein PP993_gp03 [Gordonia phage Mayweather]|uniref:Uncharacterized protein n=1 Tax=Gordonia phage Mayweather TaxID=2590931 RepID=A0A516KU05_9CAUD|nr:hypothetical protein PP993_gp03 [Gordonia phage Mayweather]QDP45165.1 hypothetical protein SEA_MAYWEATHER_3 [Gordonia phage Mayweather]
MTDELYVFVEWLRQFIIEQEGADPLPDDVEAFVERFREEVITWQQ